jgi:hypothetical protein
VNRRRPANISHGEARNPRLRSRDVADCDAYPTAIVHLFYVDESYDSAKFVITAIGMRADVWKANFEATKTFRKQLKHTFGIKLSAEIHATRFIRDLSDGISSRRLNHAERRGIFEEILGHIGSLKVKAINVCLDVPTYGTKGVHIIAIERLANRIQATMKARDSHAVVIFDEGKEKEITKLARKISVFNPIPSAYGTWPGGALSKNIVTDRILEDPVFKNSKSSYFLQWADCAAWTLLKSETAPTPFVQRLGYETLFPTLHPICFKAASRKDPWGVSR